ncbi:MAG: DnaJ domain-containing protein [Akkermansia sp.]|nr:DnaJ domain-containing protein [Akkermansia sp.]
MRADYYLLLDVAEHASAAEIKAAYRRLAKKFHPDHNADSEAAEERFKLVAEAYRVLGNPESRADYDAWLERHRHLSMAPELAQMPKRGPRVSVRHAQERRAARAARRSRSVFSSRRFSTKGAFPLARRHIIFVYIFCLSILIPWFLNFSGYGKKTESLQRERVERETAERESIYEKACGGDAVAQFRYGNILYHGLNGAQRNVPGAILWWQRAAAQGHKTAAHNLQVAVDAAEKNAAPEADAPSATVEEGADSLK